MTLTEVSSTRWNRLDCSQHPLNLHATLTSGQNFRWRRDTSTIWWGTVDRTILALWQREGAPESPLYWQTFPQLDRLDMVEQYLRLDVPLDRLYLEWKEAEPAISQALQEFRGLRILRQPPVECFFGFQCATCNTVTKIERSVHSLALRYGEALSQPIDTRGSLKPAPIVEPPPLASPSTLGQPLHAFPTLQELARADEQVLRGDLWGYRAPRVIALARHLLTLAPRWLDDLRYTPYAEAKTALTGLYGIGEKVADCICLFSLDKDDAVPVDTHVRQLACRLFLPDLAGKSLTPRVYQTIAAAFQDRFGAFAGWAQQYLFLAAMRGKQPGSRV